jgi:hypothetical protein
MWWSNCVHVESWIMWSTCSFFDALDDIVRIRAVPTYSYQGAKDIGSKTILFVFFIFYIVCDTL